MGSITHDAPSSGTVLRSSSSSPTIASSGNVSRIDSITVRWAARSASVTTSSSPLLSTAMPSRNPSCATRPPARAARSATAARSSASVMDALRRPDPYKRRSPRTAVGARVLTQFRIRVSLSGIRRITGGWNPRKRFANLSTPSTPRSTRPDSGRPRATDRRSNASPTAPTARPYTPSPANSPPRSSPGTARRRPRPTRPPSACSTTGRTPTAGSNDSSLRPSLTRLTAFFDRVAPCASRTAFRTDRHVRRSRAASQLDPLPQFRRARREPVRPEVLGERRTAVAVVHEDPRVAVRVQERLQPGTVGVRGEVVRLHASADGAHLAVYRQPPVLLQFAARCPLDLIPRQRHEVRRAPADFREVRVDGAAREHPRRGDDQLVVGGDPLALTVAAGDEARAERRRQ